MNTLEAPIEEPWQAQRFALAVAMNEAGHFAWADWAASFGTRVQVTEANRYWTVWLGAPVAVLDERGIAEAENAKARTERWQAAARATPHGQPVWFSAAGQ